MFRTARFSWSVGLASATLLLASAANAQQGPPPQTNWTPQQYPTLIKLKDDLYVIQNQNSVMSELQAFGGNCTVFITDDGVLLVDSKSERMHDDIVAKVKSLTSKPIKYVVLTHNHGDHSAGAEQFKAMGAVIIESAADRDNALRGVPPVKSLPQITYSGESALYLGGKDVRLKEYRGHTRGDTTVYFPADRIVVVGDLMTNAPGIPFIVTANDGGNWTDWLASLDALAALDFDIMVPGHGSTLTKPEFLAMRDKGKGIVALVREMNRARKTPDEIAAALKTQFDYGNAITASQLPAMLAELR